MVTNTNNYILSWKSNGLSAENIMPLSTSHNILNPSLDYVGSKIRVEFKGSCLKQNKIQFNHEKIVNIYIVYKKNKNFNISSYPTLENFLFGAVKIKRNSDIDQYKYSGYGIGLDRKGFFSFGNGTGRNAILFRVDMGSSPHIDNKKKNSLILGKGPTQELEHTLTPEKSYSINFAENNKKFCLSLHFNRANSYLFIVTKIIKFKGKDSEIIRTS